MTFNQIAEALRNEGIWRCFIVELQSAGRIEIHVPKTSKAKAVDFIHNNLPCGIIVTIKEMASPLMYKKYTYILTIE